MKKIYLLPIVLSFFIGFVMLSSCETNSSSKDNITYQIAFNKTSLSVDTYEARNLEINNPLNKEVIYSSSDESIAKIVDSQVIGVNEGEAIITATINENSKASLTVYVSKSGSVPFLEVHEDAVNVFAGSAYSLSPKVYFKGISKDCKLTYSVANNEIATITNEGLVLGVNYGDTEITVDATYLGFCGNDLTSLKRTIPVHVSEDVIILIDADNKELTNRSITINNIQYKNEALITGTISINGVKQSIEGQSLLYSSSNNEVATIEGNKIVAHSFGACEIVATYQSSLGTYMSNSIIINVDKPIIRVDNSTYDIDLSSPSFSFFDEVKIEEVESIAKIYVNSSTKALQINDITSKSLLGEQKWLIETSNYKYLINVVCCSKIITNVSELRGLVSYSQNLFRGSSGVVSFEGYYILGSDIDMNRQTLLKTVSVDFGATSIENGGFIGVFDGRGHTISNAVVSADNGGLFGTLNKASIVKNVYFKNASVTGRSGLISSYCGGTIENCFVEGSITGNGVAKAQKSLLASTILSTSNINHCIINYQNADVTLDYTSAIGTLNKAKEGNFENVYVLSTTSKVIGTEVALEYITFTSPSNGQFVSYKELYQNIDVSSFNSHWLFDSYQITFR